MRALTGTGWDELLAQELAERDAAGLTRSPRPLERHGAWVEREDGRRLLNLKMIRKRLTPEVFSSLPQLGPVAPTSGSNLLDHLLARNGLSRRIVARMPTSPLVVPIVRSTDNSSI